jgi:enterochelin esterase-like enzyme
MNRWVWRLAATVAASGALLLGSAAAAGAHTRASRAHGTAHARTGVATRHRRIHDAKPPAFAQRLSPQVRFTGRRPTGYSVTFRYYDPSATSVQIKGEWYFANALTGAQGVLPSQWSRGDFPLTYPNQGPPANWPVITMSKDQRTGVWTYTTPLPSGVFTYGFFVNCSSSTQTGCTEISDPSNPPWNQHGNVVTGSMEPTSQVYVPSDPAFGTLDFSWEAPNRVHGTLRDLTYTSPDHATPAGQNYLAIYTPPGYDPHRAAAYPTLYLLHGGGGNEVDWSTQGAAGNILDNLIDTGQIPPMVVVMPNFNGYKDPVVFPPQNCVSSPASWETDFDNDVIDNVIPYVEGHYNVSPAASERAFAGLSIGGCVTNSLLFNYTSDFGYFGVMSPAPSVPSVAEAEANATALRQVGILSGGGWQEPLAGSASLPQPRTEVTNLEAAGVGVTPDFFNGGHEWYVWRQMLRDFLTKVAFQPVLG